MNPTTIKAGRRATDPNIELKEPIMAKAQADAKKTAFNTAAKSLAKKGVTKPKHTPASPSVPEDQDREAMNQDRAPGESAPGVLGVWPGSNEVGVDKGADDVVKSGFDSTTKPENPMTETTTQVEQTAQDKAAAAAQAKIAAKQAKIDAKAAKDAKKAEDAAASKAEREAKAEKAKQERDAKNEARAAELAEKSGGKRTYFGSMLTLADRVKAGAYVKGINGQLRTDDDLAVTLEACKPEAVVQLLLKFLQLETNPYVHLNIGQQSMNLRNKARGAIRAEEGAGAILVPGTDTEPPVRATIARLRTLRDDGGYATEEGALAEKAAAKAKRDQERADKKAAKEAAAAEAKAKKDAKPEAEQTPAEEGDVPANETVHSND